jgi:hypothetical protein
MSWTWVVIGSVIWVGVGCVLALAFYAREFWMYENGDTSYTSKWWLLSNLGALCAAFWPFMSIVLPLQGVLLLIVYVHHMVTSSIKIAVKRAVARKRASRTRGNAPEETGRRS